MAQYWDAFYIIVPAAYTYMARLSVYMKQVPGLLSILNANVQKLPSLDSSIGCPTGTITCIGIAFLICYKCYLDIGTMPIESVPHPLVPEYFYTFLP